MAVGLIFAFLATWCGPVPAAHADDLVLPKPGVLVHVSPEFVPALIKGIVIHPENAFKFDFIIYKGDQPFSEAQKKEEYTKLVKYFLASLAVPDEDQWVNLSPYEKNRIIKDDFGKTLMGRDLLAQDYLLKQITASLIYPQDKIGREFWDEVYGRAYKKFGTTNIPVNTFNKVWIVPDEADIYEKGNIAYLYKSHLKVMLEEDYLALNKHSDVGETRGQDPNIHSLGSQIVREIVLPALEKEVNEGKNFAMLRQAFSGMIMAAWYKRALRQSLLSQIYANKAKVKGIDQNPQNNEAIYRRYLQAYKKGVFNYIKEETDQYTNEPMPRKYFSGGTALVDPNAPKDSFGEPKLGFMNIDSPDAARSAAKILGDGSTFDLASVSVDPDKAMNVALPSTLREEINESLKSLGFSNWVYRADESATRMNWTLVGFVDRYKFYQIGQNINMVGYKFQESYDRKEIVVIPDRAMNTARNLKKIAFKDWRIRGVVQDKADEKVGEILRFTFDDRHRPVVVVNFQDGQKNYRTQGAETKLTYLGHTFIARDIEEKKVSKRRFSTREIEARRDWELKILNEVPDGETLKLGELIKRLKQVPGYEQVTEDMVGHDTVYDERLKNHKRLILRRKQSDRAMSADVNGGIDMNSAELDLHIKRDGQGVPLPVSQQDLENIRIDGLVPVILEIRPAALSPILAQLTAAS